MFSVRQKQLCEETGFPVYHPFECWIFPSKSFNKRVWLGCIGNELGFSLIKAAYPSLHRHKAGLVQSQEESHPCSREENKHFHSLINLVEQMDTVISAKTILPRVLTFLPFIRKGVLSLVNNFPIIAKIFILVDKFAETSRKQISGPATVL